MLLVVAIAPERAWSASAELGVREIVFACRQPGKGGHWYENFGYYAHDEHEKVYGAGGRLCRLNVDTGQLTVLLDDPNGSIRDPQVHYDGGRILFSYRVGGSDFSLAPAGPSQAVQSRPGLAVPHVTGEEV